MYEIFELLCKKYGITPYKFCKSTGINSSTISTWKRNNSLARPELASKVCEYFNVSMDYLMTGKEADDKSQELTPKDELDISKRLKKTLEDLENSQEALMFDGVVLDENTKELLKASLENSLRVAKIHAKEKFSPKKYRK